MIFWFFGYPGIGKDFLAEKLSKLASIPHINADDFLTKTDKQKLIKGTFTKNDRLRKLKRIIKAIKRIEETNPNIIATDSLPDRESRQLLHDTFGESITFIYIYSSKSSHLKRLSQRKGHFFTKYLLKSWIRKHWEEIAIPYIPFPNLESRNKQLEEKLFKIFNNKKNL